MEKSISSEIIVHEALNKSAVEKSPSFKNKLIEKIIKEKQFEAFINFLTDIGQESKRDLKNEFLSGINIPLFISLLAQCDEQELCAILALISNTEFFRKFIVYLFSNEAEEYLISLKLDYKQFILNVISALGKKHEESICASILRILSAESKEPPRILSDKEVKVALFRRFSEFGFMQQHANVNTMSWFSELYQAEIMTPELENLFRGSEVKTEGVVYADNDYAKFLRSLYAIILILNKRNKFSDEEYFLNIVEHSIQNGLGGALTRYCRLDPFEEFSILKFAIISPRITDSVILRVLQEFVEKFGYKELTSELLDSISGNCFILENILYQVKPLYFIVVLRPHLFLKILSMYEAYDKEHNTQHFKELINNQMIPSLLRYMFSYDVYASSINKILSLTWAEQDESEPSLSAAASESVWNIGHSGSLSEDEEKFWHIPLFSILFSQQEKYPILLSLSTNNLLRMLRGLYRFLGKEGYRDQIKSFPDIDKNLEGFLTNPTLWSSISNGAMHAAIMQVVLDILILLEKNELLNRLASSLNFESRQLLSEQLMVKNFREDACLKYFIKLRADEIYNKVIVFNQGIDEVKILLHGMMMQAFLVGKLRTLQVVSNQHDTTKEYFFNEKEKKAWAKKIKATEDNTIKAVNNYPGIGSDVKLEEMQKWLNGILKNFTDKDAVFSVEEIEALETIRNYCDKYDSIEDLSAIVETQMRNSEIPNTPQTFMSYYASRFFSEKPGSVASSSTEGKAVTPGYERS